MRALRSFVFGAALSLSAAGCGAASTPAPPPPPAPSKPAAAVPAPPAAAGTKPAGAAATAPAQGSLVPPAPAMPPSSAPDYEAKGRRDPFAPVEIAAGAASLTIASTKLTGIVRSARSALALVETMDGIGYILRPGDTLGDGRLVEIGPDTVVFAVAAKPGTSSNRVVLKLAAN